ncbi:MAG: hypothetical protein E7Z87_05935 [Cyanobacteria bacterium SIG26]|nr:hypothetical protein [Cyanobacteria bacterium SIG26]
MKKVILLSAIMLMFGSVVNAACEYKCVPAYNLNNKFRTLSAAATGFNSLVERKVESIIKKEVLKISSAEKLDVSLQSYSPRDLKRGIFKSLKMNGTNLVMNDVHLSNLKLETLCDFNYIEETQDKVVFHEELPMSFDMTFTQDDFNKTILHDRYQLLVADLNATIAKYVKGFGISSTKVAVKANKFYMIIGFNLPMVRNEQKIVVQSDLNIKNGDIDLTNTRIVSGNLKLNLSKVDYMVKRLNPLNFSVNILENQDAKVSVQDVEIINNKIVAKGIIIIPKS